MRYVEGASLQDLIAERGRVPPGRAARVVARVADALDAAHARGLVHRDVKPANILIADPDGEEHVYLTDFGLSAGMSAAATARGAGPARSPTSRPSRSGAARSTPAPTSTRSAASSSTPSPGGRRSPPTTRRRRSRPT